MLLVTGATGNLGGSVVRHLLTHLNKTEFLVSSSTASGVERLNSEGLNARLANFSQPETLVEAFEEVTTILLVSTMDPNRLEQHKNVIDAAKKAGVERIVYTSLAIQNIETSGVKDLMISHFQTEEYLKSSGLNYTVLRNTMYAEALQQIIGAEAIAHGAFALPGGNGKVPYVLRDELGEATANVLLNDKSVHSTYQFVGSNAYSYGDLAQIWGDVSYQDIKEEDFQQALKALNLPDFAIYLHSGTIKDIKEQQYEIEDSSLEQFLGRPTATATEFLKKIF